MVGSVLSRPEAAGHGDGESVPSLRWRPEGTATRRVHPVHRTTAPGALSTTEGGAVPSLAVLDDNPSSGSGHNLGHRADLATAHPDDRAPDPSVRRGLPRGLLWALALAVVVLTIASWVALSKGGAADPDQSIVHIDPNAPQPVDPGLSGFDLTGQAAPPTTFTAFDGAQRDLASLKGTPVVLNFWASNCTACVTEMPALEEAHEKYGDKVAFIGLDSADRPGPRSGVRVQVGRDLPAGLRSGRRHRRRRSVAMACRRRC